MVTIEIIRAFIPYAFGFAGVFALYAIADSINENLYAIRCLLMEYKRIENQKDLTFEYVTCGGCGESVATGPDNFTPEPSHVCSYRFFSVD